MECIGVCLSLVFSVYMQICLHRAHRTPIHMLVVHEVGCSCLRERFTLDMLSAFILLHRSFSAVPSARQLITRGYASPVLSYKVMVSSLHRLRTPGRIQTVSRRSKLNSGTILDGEQPYPWDLLQPQDMISQHRGAKHCRR